MAGSMLIWAVEGWRAGVRMPGDVVVISALTFRILHGSRELALALCEPQSKRIARAMEDFSPGMRESVTLFLQRMRGRDPNLVISDIDISQDI